MQRRIVFFVLSVCVTIASFFIISPVQAEISNVTVIVKGMACPFCAYGIEKRLGKVEGVKSVTVDLGRGKANLQVKEGHTININQVPSAVKEAGFTPGKIRILAVGTVNKKNGHIGLQVQGAEQSFILSELKDPLKEELFSLLESGKVIEVHGSAERQADGMWMLYPDHYLLKK